MGELYERILRLHPTKDKIAVHALLAICAEQSRGVLTTAQANNIIAEEYGQTLGAAQTGNDAGLREAGDLIATVTAVAAASRAAKIIEIEEVLLLADLGIAPYDTPAALRTRLGVPDRS